MIKYVLFDLDGTLVDTAPDLAAAANKLRTDRALAPLSFDELRPLTGRGATTLVKAALGKGPDAPEFAALRKEFLRNYAARLALASKPFPGIGDLFETLDADCIQAAVVTNKQSAYAEFILNALGLRVFFAAVVGSDTSGSAMKPSPAGIRLAMAELGAAQDETIYVGDTATDITASLAAGIPCIFVRWNDLTAPVPAIADKALVMTQPEAVRTAIQGRKPLPLNAANR